jgi:hypothetical protein
MIMTFLATVPIRCRGCIRVMMLGVGLGLRLVLVLRLRGVLSEGQITPRGVIR